ncbi:MAG: CopD family protein [Acetobacteraceae bacterium]|nr:CopD family protein [Acetobacteraceae bacterium]
MIASLAYALHVVFAALWVGGMAYALLALRPALVELDGPERLRVTVAAHGRFFRLVWHAMPIVLVTGYVILFGHYNGFRGVGWHVHLMHLTGLLMAAIFVLIFLGPFRGMKAALAARDFGAAQDASARVRKLVGVNLALGLLTIAVAAWGRLGA